MRPSVISPSFHQSLQSFLEPYPGSELVYLLQFKDLRYIRIIILIYVLGVHLFIFYKFVIAHFFKEEDTFEDFSELNLKISLST